MLEKKNFEPKIVAFCCNWCSYAGADGAGPARKHYPAQIKILLLQSESALYPACVSAWRGWCNHVRLSPR